ncbi:peptidase M14 [Shewanella eurypsychrophilus]|uniref:Peptidase M14 n=1 Tax=Shewanella eurypsychrophilus TaxID=2593656 RepID=A0ABX6V0N6_9GAMM|nr:MULTISPECIES: M14 family zinc carboxypeptidase [Shewanella]QFU20582.1 peptidase M14 [Shewanella sp. YLB-09]QFU20863.1 peptidase M14 [Shewanella sp. YLB-09]QPG56152.1 peptidase M14 [Shewanella eurypsychrophilus]
MLRVFLLLLTLVSSFCLTATSLAADPQTVIQISKSGSDPTLTSPESFLGYPLGQWHLRHDQLNFYLKQLANDSERVSLELSGQTHEARQQLTAVITSKKNQHNLDDIINQRQRVKTGDKQSGPLVIWLAYSIHGDEASGAHSAMALSYFLASSNEQWIKQLLDDTIVLITPSQNPDGMDRFSTWTNNYRGQTEVSDSKHKEHRQNWPNGRTNHYFADLNRDWLFLRHPESQGRVALFHKWQPHYVGDFHEMGRDQSYFFQPGVPTRTNPATSQTNQALTEKLAQFHRQALDQIQQGYFSREIFDDFYYGKGSTYPDINGSIGVLFEQASPRGQVQQTKNGELRLTDAINNQFATSISSLKGAFALKDELIEYQSEFYQGRDKQLKRGRQTGYLIGSSSNQARIEDITQLLRRHKIEFYYLTDTVQQGNIDFFAESSLFIPINQPQKSLLIAMFDNSTEFEDPTFYDVSSWNLESAYHLKMVRRSKLDIDVLRQDAPKKPEFNKNDQSVAVLINWQQDMAAPALQVLLDDNILVKYAEKPFSILINGETKNFPAGTLQVPLKQPKHSANKINTTLAELASKYTLQMHSATTSAAISGIDLGSPNFNVIKPVKPLLITGRGTDASEVGELWYYLDRKLSVPVTLIDVGYLSRIKLNQYTHVFMAGGTYSSLDEKFARKLGQFTTDGGTIIAQKGALTWLNKNNVLKSDIKGKRFYKQLFDTTGLSYKDKEKLSARQSIGGAIVELSLDPSNPINFGIEGNRLAILKNMAIGLTTSSAPFTVAAKYADEPLISGYLAKEYQRSFSNNPAIVLETRGKGAIVALADNLMFRNIWLGSEKIYANALYLVPALN